ncbi:hypothetical protein [Paenibacillus shenyangensis]|uniref:hypothetical protein n=1 Tax=Paenibacillus sp. A9 TaxID=1284352 RepID=UPI000366C179|nr:hypothetical protein [Paenibacillus sp. A9]
MSEFTAGNIILAAHKEMVKDQLPSGTAIYRLNDKWITWLTKDDGHIADHNHKAPAYIYRVSDRVPVLYFYNAEDHWWGYQVFDQGKEIARLHFSFEYEDELVYKIAKKRYPESSSSDLLFSGKLEDLYTELKESNIFEEEFKRVFDDCNTEAFRLFGCNDEQINQLNNILNIDYIENGIEKNMSLAEEFKSIIGIPEMFFVRYDRVLESKEYEELL